MKHLIKALVVVAGFFAIVIIAEAQVSVPGPGYPLCFPVVVAGGQTVVVCQ